MRRFFVLLALLLTLVGCGGVLEESVTTVEAWTFVAEGGAPSPVTLPTHLPLPDRQTTFSLKTSVPIDAGKRGRALTLAFVRLPAIASLWVNGRRAVALEGDSTTFYRVSGAQRWSIPEEVTRGDKLDLELRLEHRSTQSAWIECVPRLSATDHGDRVFLAMRFWNEASAFFGLAVVVAAGVGYFLVWILDRRRSAHGWFVLEAIGGIAFPAYATGLTQPIFGTFDTTIMGLQVVLAASAAISFIHAYFELPYSRGFSGRRLLVAWLALCGYALIVSGPFRTTRYFAPIVALCVALSAWTQIVLCYQLTRRVPRPRNVFLVALAWPVAGLLGSVEIAWWLGYGSWFYGLQGGSAAISVVAFLRIAALGREHLRSLRKADHLNEELGRRVLLLEEKNVEVQRLNEELRRQIASRSAQLADALARIGARHTGVVLLDVGHTVAGRYRVIRPIASGGMGSVYEVERMKDSARFALKVLHGRNEPMALARFAREAQIAAQIDHPNVVSIVDMDVDADGFVFLAMELVRGPSLGELRDRYGDPSFAIPVLQQIADGLAAIHDKGIVHRDLKPANVLIVDPDTKPTVKITDFGIAMLDDGVSSTGNDAPTAAAKPTSIPAPPPPSLAELQGTDTITEAPRISSSPLTRTGVVMGTPLYMAPELLGGSRGAKPSSDVFALGVIGYFLLTGEHPFPDRRSGKLEAREAPELPKTVDANVAAVVQACLSLEPESRPSAHRVASVLAAARAIRVAS
ncbi:MAG: protein kinase domain-containing protein [Polyangiales bacterium]